MGGDSISIAYRRGRMMPFETTIPARMDRLPWARFHWLVLFALGITWILDGLEVTLTGAVSGALQDPRTLALTDVDVGFLGSAYVAGAVVGAIGFGYLTDLLGRKRLFFVTLAVYLVGVALSAFSWNVWSFAAFRFITGAGIGGEYAAINSAVDELIPARVRGRVDLIVNATYWIGAAFGAVSTIWILDPRLFAPDLGWRLGFGGGAALGLAILFLRGFVPESPRWLVLKGRREEAEKIVANIEATIEEQTGQPLARATGSLRIRPRRTVELGLVLKTMFTAYRSRSVLGLALMTSQAFLFNAIFFTYALVLTKFYGVAPRSTGLYLLPFALGNFVGPVALGHWFDTLGRKKMIAFTYAASGVLLALVGWAFKQNLLTAATQTALWSCVFFFASAAASAAYLTVSEIFPMETRGLAIAMFYALGTGIGGIAAPWIFGKLIGTGSRDAIFYGYSLAAALMLTGAIFEIWLGVDAEGKSLEDLARPLSAEADLPRVEGAEMATAT